MRLPSPQKRSCTGSSVDLVLRTWSIRIDTINLCSPNLDRTFLLGCVSSRIVRTLLCFSVVVASRRRHSSQTVGHLVLTRLLLPLRFGPLARTLSTVRSAQPLRRVARSLSTAPGSAKRKAPESCAPTPGAKCDNTEKLHTWPCPHCGWRAHCSAARQVTTALP